MSNFETFAYPGDYFDGAFQKSAGADEELITLSPANQQDIVGKHHVTVGHVDRAVLSAHKAFPAWRGIGEAKRREYLRAYQAKVKEYAPQIAETIGREVGKALWDARAEAGALASKVDLMLGLGAERTRPRDIESLPGRLRYRPHGVMAIIGPFNFPAHLPNGQIVPSLLHGNTVVFKPSERTPNVAIWMARCMHEAGMPNGVFNVVQGAAESSKALVAHEQVDAISFTGSVAVGKKIMQANLERPGRMLALELGGKNASIVLDDADLDHTARQIAYAAYASSGQRCTATSRVYATPKVIDGLAERLAKAAQGCVVGYPFNEGVFMGPMISEQSRDALMDAQSQARAAGFVAQQKGNPMNTTEGDGWYMTPSVHVAPEGEARVAGYTHDELFGPDLAIYPVRDLQHAITLTNDSRFGLAGAVFTRDQEAFDHAALNLRIGVLNWNKSSAGASGSLPFGGVGDSGNHRPAGIAASEFCAWPQATLLGDFEGELPSWPGLFG